MRNLRTKFERFCLKHRNIGIPNLMLFVSIGAAIVYVMSMFGMEELAGMLVFDRSLILRGQVWRLFTYIFVYNAGNVIFTVVTLLCYFSLGRAIENAWGTLRFNLFYFTGMLLADAFCMIFGGRADVYYLNLSLFLSFATLYPDARFLLFFFIPVKAWIFALVDLGLTLFNVITLALGGFFPYCLFPLVAIANYFLFFGKDVVNVLPPAWRRRRPKKDPRIIDAEPVRRAAPKQEKAEKKLYTHRCTVCGRTDVSHPDLEFRYCSRCKGYFCYCEDHISNHNHVE